MSIESNTLLPKIIEGSPKCDNWPLFTDAVFRPFSMTLICAEKAK